jgi:hypothetical protein
MTIRERERIAEQDPEALFADGWDDCIMGTAFSPGRKLLVVYDGDLIIQRLVKRDGMSQGEAEEYFSFNIEGAWVGERTPVYVRWVEP